jgi:hypothetical protein
MNLVAQREGLALRATVVTANLAKDQLMKITGDKTVDKAGANDHAVGRLVVPSRTANGIGTVEVRYKERVKIKFSGNLLAGTYVKLAAVDGSTGESVAAAWVSGTDAWERLYGVVWVGANGAVGEVLTF